MGFCDSKIKCLQGLSRSTRRKAKHPHHNLDHLESIQTNQSSGPEKSRRSNTTANQPTEEQISDAHESNSIHGTSNQKITRSAATATEPAFSRDRFASSINAELEHNTEPARNTSRRTNPWLEEYIAKFPEFKQETNPGEWKKSQTRSSRSAGKAEDNESSCEKALPQAQNSVSTFPIHSQVNNEFKIKLETISNENVLPDIHNVNTDGNTTLEFPKLKNKPSEFLNVPSELPDKLSHAFLSQTTGLYNTSAVIDFGKPVDKNSMSAFVDMLNKLSPNMKTDVQNNERGTKGHEHVIAFGQNEQASSSHREPYCGQINHGFSRNALNVKSASTLSYTHEQGSFTSGRHRSKPSPSGKSSMTEPEKLSAYKCHKCGNAYARMHSLSRHVKFECGVAPKFECYICHKRSKHKHNLLLHMKTHTTHK